MRAATSAARSGEVCGRTRFAPLGHRSGAAAAGRGREPGKPAPGAAPVWATLAAVDQPRATLAAGMEVTSSVRLLSPLGAGGMGAVWLADHTALNTRVVVKFMLGGLDSSASARARFKREAEAASQVKSPHVVQTFDYGVTAAGVPFIVMEHLEGRDLGAEIAARGSLEPALVVSVVAQVAKALAKAHGAGLLHRDIKPDNIFLCQSEGEDELFVKLLDFGIAKTPTADGEAELDGQTKTGQVVGTPYYMSPEQVTAQKTIDLRSDLWSLGIVAFEALTGTRPYDGPSFGALAVKIATGEPPRPSDANPSLPATVDAWFAKACAREPSSRFASARELADGLRAAFEGVVSLPPAISGMSDSGPRDAQASAAAPPAVPTPLPSSQTLAAVGNAVTAVDERVSAASGAAPIPSAPPGPISVDDDGRPRNSFVLASTIDPHSTSDEAPLARSGARGGGPTRAKILIPVAGLLAITLAIAVGWKAKESVTEETPASSGGASDKNAGSGAGGASAEPLLTATSSAASGADTDASPTATSSAASGADTDASAPTTAGAASRSGPSASVTAAAPAHVRPAVAATRSAVSTAAPPSVRPHASSTAKPVASTPAPRPSAKAAPTTNGDPLY
jgi:eukaryotic-like serine/threonine-protein kinase